MTEYKDRKYDLVIFGATGFTGALTCEYLTEIEDKNISWAIAGRSLKKLEKVKERLCQLDESLKDLPLLFADSTNPESLDNVASQTRVILSTVGPFIKYGTPLVEACIRQQTHYADTTGEYHWVKQIIERFHDEAKEKKVMIVPCCGFDSVPSDLGVYMTCKYLQDKHGLDAAGVKNSLISMKAGVSGGTIQSILGVLSDSPLTLKQDLDPYLLATRSGVDRMHLPPFTRDRDFSSKLWQVLFVMSPTNERVVRRSWSLWADRGRSYGSLFTYREYMSMKFLPALFFTAAIYTTMPLLFLLFRMSWFSRLIKRLLPQSGSGPNAKERANGRFEFNIVATAETEPYAKPVRVKGIVKGFRDPGYGDTCRMVAESALSIIHSLDRLPGKEEGGVLTPASAFGEVLLERLTKNQGMVFYVEDLE